MLTMRTAARQRLWTLVSLLPIAVLCGVVAYAYLIRPWRASNTTKATWAAQREEIRPLLLDLLSEEQTREIKESKAKYQADLADLPSGLQRNIKRLLESSGVGGKRLVEVKVGYAPSAIEDPVAGEVSVHIFSTVSPKSFSVAFGCGEPAGARRRGKPRPQIMRRISCAVVDQQVSPNEFEAWWEWTATALIPLAGPPHETPGQPGVVVASSPPPPARRSASQLAQARQCLEYLLNVLPKPEPSEPVSLGDLRDADYSVYYTDLTPQARVEQMYLGAALPSLTGVPASGSLRYGCGSVGGALWLRWDPQQDETMMFLQFKREK
jgi:hypothetical protein